MIPLLSRAQLRALDRDAVDRLGVPGAVLMENAGAQAAAILRARFPTQLGRVLVLGGVGQNGGDAWVVARHLLVHSALARGSAGFDAENPRCLLLGERARVKGDALLNLQALEALGVRVVSIASADALAAALQTASLIIDGLFGTGLDRPLTGLARAAVEAVNAADRTVVALDLPSGVAADSGQVLDAAIRATLTVTFAAHKLGLHQHPGAALCGELHCVHIGVPVQATKTGLIEAGDVAALLPLRAADTHKGAHGHVLVIAGSAGKTGAAFLAASAALRTGAGLVTIASDPETRRALDHKVVEIMTAELSGDDRLGSALALAEHKAAAVVGPGLGLDDESQRCARELALSLPVPSVIDADALTALGTDLRALRGARAPRVLTPHPGEAARMLGTSTPEVQRDRIAAARALADATGQVVALKGARTVIAAPDGALRIASAGTPALGTAGTGDVLSGVIGALCGQLAPFEAAFCGVELHARAGELAAPSDRGLIASDLLPALARALEACRGARSL